MAVGEMASQILSEWDRFNQEQKQRLVLYIQQEKGVLPDQEESSSEEEENQSEIVQELLG